MTTVFRLLLLCALGLPAAFPALADSPVAPAACKAPGALRRTIASFQFSAAELQAFKDNHPRPTSVTARQGMVRRATLSEAITALLPAAQQAAQTATAAARLSVGASHGPIGPPRDPGGDATCGVVDFWLYAAVDAYSYCNAPERGNGQAYFKVTSPASFNAHDHHVQYANFEQGLEGTCYVCEAPHGVKSGDATAVPRKGVRAVQPATGS